MQLQIANHTYLVALILHSAGTVPDAEDMLDDEDTGEDEAVDQSIYMMSTIPTVVEFTAYVGKHIDAIVAQLGFEGASAEIVSIAAQSDDDIYLVLDSETEDTVH